MKTINAKHFQSSVGARSATVSSASWFDALCSLNVPLRGPAARFSINQAQLGARIIRFNGGEFGAEMLEGYIISRCAQAMDLNRQRLGLRIRDEVGLGLEDLTRQASG